MKFKNNVCIKYCDNKNSIETILVIKNFEKNMFLSFELDVLSWGGYNDEYFMNGYTYSHSSIPGPLMVLSGLLTQDL